MLRTFIQISSMALTVEAALFLAMANFGLSARVIARLSRPYYGYNDGILRNLSFQRATTWIGFVLLMIAFLLQMGNALWPMAIDEYGPVDGCGLVAGIGVSVGVGLAGYFVAKRLAKRTYEQAMKQIIDQSESRRNG